MSFFYRTTRSIVRLVLFLYFRKIEVDGRENIPLSGAVLLAANHPQSITDALVLAVSSPRPLHYLAHRGLFRNRFVAWLLRRHGVLPVTRARESQDPDRNAELFAACHEILVSGGGIGIFPEGISSEAPRLQPLKSGAARMALACENQNEWHLNLSIIPVGINFESRRRFRSRVLVRFGQALGVRSWQEQYGRDVQAAVEGLTKEIATAIRQNVIDIAHAEYEELVSDLETVYKGDVLARQHLDIPGNSQFQRDQWLSREIPRALDYYLEQSPELIWRVRRLLREYGRKRDRLHLKDETLRQRRGTTVPGAATRFVLHGVLGLPLAAYGALWNWLPYKVTGKWADHFAPNDTKVHHYRLMFGVPIYLVYYGALFYLAERWLGGWGMALFGLTLPPAGFFARWYSERMALRRDRIRLGFLELQHGYMLRELRQTRARLIDEIDAAAVTYLRAMNDS